MGVKGLWKALKPYVRDGHLSQFRGQRVAVDMYVWLHQSLNGCVCIHYENLEAYLEAKYVRKDANARITIEELVVVSSRYIDFIVSRVEALQKFGVVPVCVFDGTEVPMKQHTETERAQRRQACFEDALHMLEDYFRRSCLGQAHSTLNRRSPVIAEALQLLEKAFDISPELAHGTIQVLSEQRHIECIVAPYEADAELSYLCREGYVQAVISEDSDLIAYYCPCIIAKLANFTGRCEVIMPMDCVPVFYEAVARTASRRRRGRHNNSNNNSNSDSIASSAVVVHRPLVPSKDARRACQDASPVFSPSASLSMEYSSAPLRAAGANVSAHMDTCPPTNKSVIGGDYDAPLYEGCLDLHGMVAVVTESGGGSSDSADSALTGGDDAGDGAAMLGSGRPFSYESFLLACVMGGCDYVPNLRSVGIMTAFKLVTQSNSLTQLMQTLEVEFGFPAAELRLYRRQVLSAFFCFAHHIVYCPLRKKTVHYHPLPLASVAAVAGIPPSLTHKHEPNMGNYVGAVENSHDHGHDAHVCTTTSQGRARHVDESDCRVGDEGAESDPEAGADVKAESRDESRTTCGLSGSNSGTGNGSSCTNSSSCCAGVAHNGNMSSSSSSSSRAVSTSRPDLTGQLWPAEVARQICEMCVLDPTTHKPYLGTYQRSVQEYLTRTRRGQTSLTAYEGFTQHECNKIVMRGSSQPVVAATVDSTPDAAGFDQPLVKVSEAHGYLGSHRPGAAVGRSCWVRSKYFMRTRLELMHAESETSVQSVLGTVNSSLSHVEAEDDTNDDTQPSRLPPTHDEQEQEGLGLDWLTSSTADVHPRLVPPRRARSWHDVDADDEDAEAEANVSEPSSPVLGLLALLPSSTTSAADVRESADAGHAGDVHTVCADRDDMDTRATHTDANRRVVVVQSAEHESAAVPATRCACPFAYWQCNRPHSIFDQCFLGKQWVRGGEADADAVHDKAKQPVAAVEDGPRATDVDTTKAEDAVVSVHRGHSGHAQSSYRHVITPYRAPRATTERVTAASDVGKGDIFARLTYPRRRVEDKSVESCGL